MRWFQPRPGTHQKDDNAGENKKFRQLSLSPQRDRGERDEDAPEQRIAFVGAARELVSGDGDDRNDRRADRVEQRLHPPEPAVGDIDQRDADHH